MIPLWMLFLAWTSDAGWTNAAGVSPRAEVVSAIDSGATGRARAILDSLLAIDPTDAGAAYWAARIEEQEGRLASARRRYLALEAGAPGSPAARLAEARRRALERRQADRLVERGVTGGAADVDGRTILLLPPEALSGDAGFPLFGLTWSYLVGASLRGGAYCPVPVPSMLVVEDLLRVGRATRAPASVSVAPVNTIDGLRARLAILPDEAGAVYLEEAAGGWDETLERALIRFQQAAGLAPTGEADLPTQARLEEMIEQWLERPPEPVEPKLLPRAAELLGASVLVRGTYRREAGEIEVSLSLLESDGTARRGEPIVMRFPPSRAPEAAAEAARRIADRLGTTLLAPEPPWSLPPEELERATSTLLLIDRGLPQPAEARWLRGPQVWFDWPMVSAARAVLAGSAEDLGRWEAELRRAWTRPAGLDAASAFDLLARDLGLPILGARPAPEPSAIGVLGREAILHVHGSGE